MVSLKCAINLILLLFGCLSGYAENLPEEAKTTLKLDAEVIVIGAGASGIAAATKLAQNGIDVKILEVEGRLGGRINSVPFGDSIVDLGAEWCHGEKGNIVYELMKDSGILKHSYYDFDAFLHSSGIQFDDDFYEELDQHFVDLYTNPKAVEGENLGEYFIREYYKFIHQKYATNQTRFRYAQEAMQTYKSYILSSEGALSWFDPSAMSDFEECEGDRLMTWSGKGFRSVLDKLLTGFDQENRLLLNREVMRIMYGNKNYVEVVLKNGQDGEMETMKAAHVIFTPSIGVLKRRHLDLFMPCLDPTRVKSIQTIGFGGVMKVLVHYKEAWWSKHENFSGNGFVWSLEDRDTLVTQFNKGPQKYGSSWLLNFMGTNRLEKNPNALSCWFTGEFVPELELVSDDILIEGITFAFKKFLGHMYTVTTPDKIARSKWYHNPNVRGTYSFQTVESRKLKPSANEILSQPIKDDREIPRVLFAGEATNPVHYSTVHGAIETGFREAQRIIDLKTESKAVTERI